MLKQIEGSRAMAEGIALCRPEVICAYPITPQTHIVEGLGEMVRSGELKNCEFINVESEFAALSVATAREILQPALCAAPVPVANPKQLTDISESVDSLTDERSLPIDLVRLDRAVPAAGYTGSRNPCSSTPAQHPSA